MCFDLDSAPPIPVIAGAAVSHERVTLGADDGNTFAAFVAEPEDPTRVGIAILPDVRGLYRFYEELALRLAERGYAAVAFDYFGRTAHRWCSRSGSASAAARRGSPRRRATA